MRHNRRILGVAAAAAAGAIAVAAIAGPVLAGGPNMVTNGDFASNANGWTGNPLVGIKWSAGHGEVSLYEDNATATGGYVMQCLGPATPGHIYEYGGEMYIPAGQPRNGFATVVITYYAGPNCTNAFLGGKSTTQMSAKGAWQSSTGTMTAPPSTASLGVWLNPSKADIKFGGKSDDAFTAWYDNVFVTDQGQDPKAPMPTPPPQGSPIPVPTKQPTQPPAPTSTPFVPVITIPDDAVWPPLPTGTAAPKPSNTPPARPSNTPPADTHAPQTRDEGNTTTPPTTPPQSNEPHATGSDVPAAATPLPPLTGSGTTSDSRSDLPELAGLACIVLGAASFAAARRKR